jgi:hypothetical protein
MFHGKFVKITEVQPIIKTQAVTIYVNVVDVNVTTKSKTIEKICSKINSQGKQRMLLIGIKNNG